MTTRKLRASAADAGEPLGSWLAERLGVDFAAAEALVFRGAVYVNRSRQRDPARALAAGDRITVHEGGAAALGEGWRVVVETDYVLVVDKPSGLASQATREAGGALDEQVAARYPGARPMHRLDREASGLVLFARTPEARRELQAHLENGRIEREYRAVVWGAPPDDRFVLDAPLGRNPHDYRRFQAGVPGGRAAVTHVDVLERRTRVSLLKVVLDTGRTHQIRAHLAGAGFPLLGDTLYAAGEAVAAAPRLALHACRLAWPGGVAEAELPAELAELVG